MMQHSLTILTVMAAGLACAATLLGFLGRVGWLCELASHFRLQYTWILGVSTVVFLAGHQWLAAALAAGAALMNFSLIAPFYAVQDHHRMPRPRIGGQSGAVAVERHAAPMQPVMHRAVRVLLSNVLSTNRSHDRLRRLIDDVNPDVALLIETNAEWMAALAELSAAYPFSEGETLPGHFGIHLISRLPLEQASIVRIGGLGLPSIMAHLRLPGYRVTLIGTHPLSPISPLRARLRNQHLAELAQVVRRQPGPVMVLGDLNTSSWSPAFRTLIRTAHLRDSRAGFGLQPTWPVLIPWLRIPIDHCLVTSEIIVHNCRRTPSIGSDHFPLLVDFSIEIPLRGIS